MNFVFKKRNGASLFLAMGLAGLVLLIGMGAATMIMNSLNATIKIEGKNAAYFAAEGALELALFDVSNHGSGYEIDPGNKDGRWDGDDGAYSYVGNDEVLSSVPVDDLAEAKSVLPNEAKGWWSVEGLSQWNDSEGAYVIPAAGEGSAEDADWNKINLNNPLSLDLYVDGSAPGPVVESDYAHFQDLPGNLDENSLVVRLRLPEGSADLDTTDGAVEQDGLVEYDPTILSWVFSGYDATVGEDFRHLFFANDSLDFSYGHNKRQVWNTEISASRLNKDWKFLEGVMSEESGAAYVAFDLSVPGMDTFEQGRCPAVGVTDCAFYPYQFTALETFFGSTIPTTIFQNLKISLINDLLTLDEDGKKKAVENVEYQVLSSKQIPDTVSTIMAEGVVGEYPYLYRQKIQTKLRQNSAVPIFDFVFLEK